jgi:hypothetical protein
MQGPHGMIQARQHSKTQKVFPTVKLLNFDKSSKVFIKCALYQFDQIGNVNDLHPHKLIMRKGEAEECDPHYVEVNRQNGFTAM